MTHDVYALFKRRLKKERKKEIDQSLNVVKNDEWRKVHVKNRGIV